MRWLIPVLSGLIAFTSLGCLREKVITPHEKVIVKSEERDFGITGRWVAVQSGEAPLNSAPQPFTIKATERGEYTLVPESKQNEPVAHASLHIMSLDQEEDYALIEVEISIEEKPDMRFLMIGHIAKDKFTVWWLVADNLAEVMFADDHSAVIEHKLLATTVRAKPSEIIATVRDHWRELVGEPMVFQALPVKNIEEE